MSIDMVKNCLKCNKEFVKSQNVSLKKWQTSKFGGSIKKLKQLQEV